MSDQVPNDASVASPFTPLVRALVPELLHSPEIGEFIERIVDGVVDRLRKEEARKRGENLMTVNEVAKKFKNWTKNRLRYRLQCPDDRWRQLKVSRKSGGSILIDVDALSRYDEEGEIR